MLLQLPEPCCVGQVHAAARPAGFVLHDGDGRLPAGPGKPNGAKMPRGLDAEFGRLVDRRGEYDGAAKDFRKPAVKEAGRLGDLKCERRRRLAA